MLYTGLMVNPPVLPGPKRLGPKMLDPGSQNLCLRLLSALEHELCSAVYEIKCANITEHGFGLFQMFTRVQGMADMT